MDAPPQSPPVFENIPLRNVESHWEALFNQFDRNGDGKIPIHYLSRELSENQAGVPEYVVKRVIALADQDRDGFITYPEFIRLVESPHTRPLLQASLQKYVQIFVPRGKRIVEAVDGSYEQEYTCEPPALTMIVISIIEIFFFMYDVIVSHENFLRYGPFFKLFHYNPQRRIEIWRYLTHMFIHSSEMHLSTNLAVQILLGIPLEMVHRWWRVLIIYLIGVISGALMTSLTTPRAALVGASGGCYSLLAAHIATVLMNWKEMDHPALQLTIFLILISFDTGSVIYKEYVQKIPTQIGLAAHIGGAIAGFCVGVYILRNIKVRKWEQIFWRICAFGFSVFIVAAILWNVFVPSWYPLQEV